MPKSAAVGDAPIGGLPISGAAPYSTSAAGSVDAPTSDAVNLTDVAAGDVVTSPADIIITETVGMADAAAGDVVTSPADNNVAEIIGLTESVVGTVRALVSATDTAGVGGVTDAVSPAVSYDPFWDDVMSLMRFNDTDFEDEKPGRSWVTSGADIYATPAHFGAGVLGPEATGPYMYSPGPDWAFGTTDFTVECFIYLANLPDPDAYYSPMGTWDADDGWCFVVGSDGHLAWRSNALTITATSGEVTTETWHHIAYSRGSGTGRLFLDGVQVATGSDGEELTRTNSLIVKGNRTSTDDFPGFIDELRITSAARYASGFSPPTDEYPAFGPPEVVYLAVTENMILTSPAVAEGGQGEIFDVSVGEAVGVGDTSSGDFAGSQESVSAALRVYDEFTSALRPGSVLVETLDLADVSVASWHYALLDAVIAGDQVAASLLARATCQDAVRVADLLRVAFPAPLAEGLIVADTLQVIQGVHVVDRLGISDLFLGAARRQVSLVESVRLVDAMAQFLGASVAEALAVLDVLEERSRAGGLIDDNLILSDALTPLLVLRAAVADTVSLSDEQLLRMIWAGDLLDTIALSIGYFGIGGEFTAWTMNTRTSAVTEYRDFVFNSFARVRNICLGASDTGLYELVGDTDVGEDIVATLRGGYMQFGGTHLSRLKEAYISLRAPNDKVLLKIISGDGMEYLYEVDTRSMRNTKVHMGKGMRARYFAYELTSVGQDFDLDSIEFVPLVVARRV